jgi:hypothetical protein
MKKLLFIALLLVAIKAIAQDKIVKTNDEIIICTVTEVMVSEIKYYYADRPKIIFSIDKTLVNRIEFATGEVITMSKDSFNEMEYYAGQKQQDFKLNFLSPLVGFTEISYERVIKPGRLFEGSLGIIGLGYDTYDYNPAGVFVKATYKLVRTPDYYTSRMRYSHLLKGGYIAPELAIKYMKFDDYSDYWYSYEKTRQEDLSVALMLKFGKQWVYDNVFLVDLFCGIGYGLKTYGESTPYGFVIADSDFPMAFTGGLRIGFAF